MAGNSFGKLFQVTTFGESHGPGIGVVIDGCPSKLEIDTEALAHALKRRRPGQSEIVTARNEPDEFVFLSGVINQKTTGAPLCIWIPNKDQRSKDYDHLKQVFRPSHADFTYEAKYGLRDVRGGGRSSARETAARVAAGAIAEQVLNQHGIDIVAYVSQVGDVKQEDHQGDWNRENVDSSIVRNPDPDVANRMIELIKDIKKAGDTVGGVVTCRIRNCPVGLGEPVFDKLHADLGKAMLSINACKGFEIGSGFNGPSMRGSEHNDEFYTDDEGFVRTRTNNSGGVQGGISNGMDIVFNVAFKPVSTLMRDQSSVDSEGNETTVKGKGRHDPCVVPRAVPIVEAMAAIVLADHLLRHIGYGK